MENNTENDNLRIIRYFLASLILLFVVVFLAKYNKELTHMDMKHIRSFVLSYGKFAMLCFIIVFSLKPVLVFVPTSLFSIIAGSLFGLFKGLCLNMLCSFISATIAFYLARFLGKPFVERTLGKKTMKLDFNFEKKGFVIMLLMRLSMIFPYDPLSYASGLTKIKYRDFIAGTLLGIFPEMIAYSYMGDSIKHPFSFKFLIPVILVVLLAGISYIVYKKYKKEA